MHNTTTANGLTPVINAVPYLVPYIEGVPFAVSNCSRAFWNAFRPVHHGYVSQHPSATISNKHYACCTCNADSANCPSAPYTIICSFKASAPRKRRASDAVRALDHSRYMHLAIALLPVEYKSCSRAVMSHHELVRGTGMGTGQGCFAVPKPRCLLEHTGLVQQLSTAAPHCILVAQAHIT